MKTTEEHKQTLTASTTPVLIRPEDVDRLAQAPALDRTIHRLLTSRR